MQRTHFAVVCLVLAATLSRAQTATESNTPAQTPSQSSAPAPASGQTSPTTASPNPGSANPGSANTGSANTKDQAQPSNEAATSKDRLFFALPNFLTLENAANVPPLSAGGKFKVVARGSFDPIQIVWYGALSGISQAENSEPGFGQGWEAYGKRYGAYAADGTIENFFVGAIFPAMLHQDPRYFQSGHGTFFHRATYSVSRIVVTRADSGDRQFNYSEIVGSALASAISTYSYHPHPGYHPIPGENVRYIASDRTFRNTASVWGSQVGYDTITLVIKEFWPDIRRKIKKQPRSPENATAPGPQTH
ncbi:MAG: hypothetical protein WBQ72_08460 [Terriglobales bacterium]